MAVYKTIYERARVFWSKVDRSGGPNACWLWTKGKFSDGYGAFSAYGKTLKAQRVAYTLSNKLPALPELCVLHNCPGGDNPLCCNPKHLWLGTTQQNTADKVAKGRQARGLALTVTRDTARGARHGSKTHPECAARGDRHGSHTHPERQVRGNAHWSRQHPEKIKRGKQHYKHLHPELSQGELNGNAKLTSREVRVIRSLYRLGSFTKVEIGRMIGGVSDAVVRSIVQRRTWRHVL